MPLAVRVPIVEDDPVHAEEMASALERNGYLVCGVAPTSDDAERIGLAERPEIVISDLRLRGPRSGLDIAAALRRHYRFGLILLTGFAGPELLRRRMRSLELVAILAKPIDACDLLDVVCRAAPPQRAGPLDGRATGVVRQTAPWGGGLPALPRRLDRYRRRRRLRTPPIPLATHL
jgi:DNA-binding NtrC family response regulator